MKPEQTNHENGIDADRFLADSLPIEVSKILDKYLPAELKTNVK